MSEEVSQDAAPEVAPEAEITGSPSQENAPEVDAAMAADPEAAAEIAEALEDGEITEEQAVEMIKQLTIKVDGKEIVRDLPFEVDPNNKEMLEYLREREQLATVSQKRMQEKAEFEKLAKSRESEMEAFLNNLKDESVLQDVLSQLGHDPSQLAENILMKEIEKSQLSPEQRELEEVRAELARIKEAEEAAKKEAADAKQAALEQQYADNFDRDLNAAIDKYGLPDTPHIIREMSNLMRIALTNNLDASFEEIGQLVKEQNDLHVQEVLKGMDAEKLMQILKDNQLNDIVLKRAPKPKKEVPPTANSIKEGGEVGKKEDSPSGFRTRSLNSWLNS
jgi:antitoxin component of RelBE/YafQ-DinJ toxin-antitoxin module